jgi:hypothetical protein
MVIEPLHEPDPQVAGDVEYVRVGPTGIFIPIADVVT